MSDDLLPKLLSVIRKHWGFDSLRPLQEAAIRATLAKRDSLVVLPTGGGKSLCYQAPAVFRGGTTIVLSPLISLMKDQVDALRSNGVPAVALNSAVAPEEVREAERAILRGEIRLVFASPERMATGAFRNLARQANVQSFAIDEAHCISHWGHDFRPEYRQLRQLKELFPQTSVHAFTATATNQVRQDIIDQLGLAKPEVLVGNFDRPNLTYRVIPRQDMFSQVTDCLKSHTGEAGIIYCIRRRDVDDLCASLQRAGVRAKGYHAGLTSDERKAAQDAFVAESCDVIVATVAFGMGIDRSNIRYVLHTGMPKSVEHYQQETGRAGRDGLEAECVLLYSAADAMTWRSIVDKSAAESQVPVDPEYMRIAHKHITEMDKYCRPIACRHKALVEYFGQTYEAENCEACDLCLGDADPVEDANTVAKKILSCVYRVQERFGMNHVADILRGADTESIRQWKHESLSTYGLLQEFTKTDIRDFIQQLLAQDVLALSGNERPILKLNQASWDVMKDKATVRLLKQPGKKESKKSSAADGVSWEGVDKPLFESLRELRKAFSQEKGVPPYVIFSDNTLRQLSTARPSTLPRMQLLYGIGAQKLADYGQAFLDRIDAECASRGLSRDVALPTPAPAKAEPSLTFTQGARAAAPLFEQGLSVAEVATRLGRARSTVSEYLSEYIRLEKPASVEAWVSPETYREVVAAAEKVGAERLKPIYVELGERVSYDEIRVALGHWSNQANPPRSPT